MSTELEGELVFKLQKMIAEGKARAMSGFYLIGEALTIARSQKVPKMLGLSFAQYISLPEIQISRAGAYQAMSVWQEFGQLPKEGIHPSRLILLAPLKLKPEEKTAALDAARDLSSRDFKNYLRKLNNLTVPDECPHHKLITICEECKARVG